MKEASIAIISSIVTTLVNYWIEKRKKLDELKINKIDEAETTLAYITEILVSYRETKVKEKEYRLYENKIDLHIAQFRRYDKLKQLLRDFKQYSCILIEDELKSKNDQQNKGNKEILENTYKKIIEEFEKILI
ncbi:hypothetical protein HF847_11335 [Clostridium cochlearium]|uniref:hypothetical protein n=1 Tax=Clostridium cochlearium TaxID=1494 RepID=UPI000BBC320C|nr:hypothetical protein [Clostridium cochlearium]NME96565.1 hypothetical protein [Clostridium cochlearium]